MTTNKNFKRLVRARMSKTGESYTSARANVMTGGHKARPYGIEIIAPIDYDKLAGMSSAKVKAATGCGWDKWVYVLDKAKAYDWSHREIVDYARKKYKTPDWWAQMVVVGYERIKGLRAIGQRRGGGFEATKSKTVPVPVDQLYKAWSNARTRAKWLPGVKYTVRTSQPNKSLRITWPDATNVEVGFYPKGAGKSFVAIAHTKLDGKADADERKKFWGERFAALATVLAK